MHHEFKIKTEKKILMKIFFPCLAWMCVYIFKFTFIEPNATIWANVFVLLHATTIRFFSHTGFETKIFSVFIVAKVKMKNWHVKTHDYRDEIREWKFHINSCWFDSVELFLLNIKNLCDCMQLLNERIHSRQKKSSI